MTGVLKYLQRSFKNLSNVKTECFAKIFNDWKSLIFFHNAPSLIFGWVLNKPLTWITRLILLPTSTLWKDINYKMVAFRYYFYIYLMYNVFVENIERKIYKIFRKNTYWYFARFGSICAIQKTWKAPIGECYF